MNGGHEPPAPLVDAEGSEARDDHTPYLAPSTSRSQRTDATWTPICRDILAACNARRIELNLPLEPLSEFLGLPDRYLAKAIHCDKPSGRQPTWQTLDVIFAGLYPRRISDPDHPGTWAQVA